MLIHKAGTNVSFFFLKSNLDDLLSENLQVKIKL